MIEKDFEVWLDIKGYIGLYKVSNLGRIKKLKFEYTSPFYGKIFVPDKILKGSFKDGYYQIALFKNGIKELFLVHRIVAMAFIKNINNKPFVNHKDSIKNNNKVENLEWVTSKENSIHAHKSGTFKMPSGEKSINTKLKTKDIDYIKNNPDKMSQKQLANKFKVSQGGISKIKNNKNWKFHTIT